MYLKNDGIYSYIPSIHYKAGMHGTALSEATKSALGWAIMNVD